MRVLLFVTILAAMCWPLWTAFAEARVNQGPHNSSTLELALIGLGTLVLFQLAKQARQRRSVHLTNGSATFLAIHHSAPESHEGVEVREPSEHAA